MKILFISDIHANYEALKVLEPYIGTSDFTICLGDIIGYHCHVNEVIEFLKTKQVLCIKGNHDLYLLEGMENHTKYLNESVRFGIEIAKKNITEENYKWLENLPTALSLRKEGVSILCCHGSPWDVTNGYVYEDSALIKKMIDFKYDVIALGHTHHQYFKTNNGVQIIFNPGSVGQARDQEGLVSAKVLCTKSKTLETIALNYNYQEELNYSKSQGAGDWIYKHFKSILN